MHALPQLPAMPTSAAQNQNSGGSVPNGNADAKGSIPRLSSRYMTKLISSAFGTAAISRF